MSTPESKKNYNEVDRSINEIIEDLSKPIPEKYLRHRKQGGTELTYIPWHEATKLLDYYAPGWNYTVELQHIANKVVCIATISITSSDAGVTTRQATGYEEENATGYGDPFSNAESMALRRAASKFGLGRYLYK